MELQSSQWHVRLYLWARESLFHFWGRDWAFRPSREKQTNLCQYIRTLFIWMPLWLVLHGAVLAWLVFAFIYAPLKIFGVVSLGVFLAKILGGLLAVVVVVTVFVLAGEGIKRLKKRQKPLTEEERQQRQAAKAAAPPSLASVVGSYIVAQKQKICPAIQLVEKNHA